MRRFTDEEMNKINDKGKIKHNKIIPESLTILHERREIIYDAQRSSNDP